MSVDQIFKYLQEMEMRKASDLYLTVGYPPTLRVEDELIKLTKEPLEIDSVREMINSVLTSRQKREYEIRMELNTALDMGEHGRFRINVMRQRQNPGMVIRRIISDIPDFENLRLPSVLESLSMEKRGLVLLTGMTGSGKSTTLASMVDYRNRNGSGHIVTIEDPIEFYHDHRNCVITQREVGVDTDSYPIALKNALRQRPDVILVGEIRDREVMEQALMSSETGHLCLATIHANNAYQAIERVVNLFPEDQSGQVRLNMSMNLKAIISQRLIPGQEGKLVPAVEVLLNQGLVRELIFKGDITKIHDVMEKNTSSGMCTFDQSLLDLRMRGLINDDTVLANSDRPADMKVKLNKIDFGQTSGSKKAYLKHLDTSLLSLKD